MESPENKVSFINRQFYVWMDKLIRRGYQKALTVEDIYRMDEAMETRNLYRMWTYEWNLELFRCKLIRPFHRWSRRRYSRCSQYNSSIYLNLTLKQIANWDSAIQHDYPGIYGFLVTDFQFQKNSFTWRKFSVYLHFQA